MLCRPVALVLEVYYSGITLHTIFAKYSIDDLYSRMEYCVEVGTDSRIVSRSTKFLDEVVLF